MNPPPTCGEQLTLPASSPTHAPDVAQWLGVGRWPKGCRVLAMGVFFVR